MEILITGSEGVIGKVISRELKKEGHALTLLDKNSERPVDLLQKDISPHFKGIETVIHLAANSKPGIEIEEAQENVDMTWNVSESCRINGVKRVINASSMNVYDLYNLYPLGEITSETPVCPNSKPLWGCGEQGKIFYGMSKIISEEIIKNYHNCFGISAINLRLGQVSANNSPSPDDPENTALWLSHQDLNEIVKRAINFNGLESLVCVSNNSEDFVDLAPIERILGYTPK